MVIILVILGLGLVGTSLFLVFSSKSQNAPQESFIKKDKLIPLTKEEPPSIKDEKPESPGNSLQLDYQKLSEELSLTREREKQLNMELEKLKSWNEKSAEELEKLNKECNQMKEILFIKEKESADLMQKNLNLAREIEDSKQKISVLEGEKRHLNEEILFLKTKLSIAEKDSQEKEALIKQFREREKESQWVSKQEYEELKKELLKKEQELEKIKQGFNPG
ncbi:MAG: hypothetical protein N2Z79_03560 [Candidatus Omnitrophica bacterium]|nr:hypothetical protein [Candidatus Omnitrophota bacterium]